MKKTFLFLFILLSSLIAEGQVWLWAKDFNCGGDDGWVATDLSGNIYKAISVACSFGTVNTAYSGNIYKISPGGNGIWALSSINQKTFGTGICTDLNGNVFLSGNYYDDTAGFGSLRLISPKAGTNAFLVKVNSLGTPLWLAGSVTKSSHGDFVSSVVCATDKKGNVFSTGFFADTIMFGPYLFSAPSFPSANFLAKYDANGNLLWVQKNDTVKYDQYLSLATDSDGSVYIADNYGISKFDSNGSYKWSLTGHRLNTNGSLSGYSVTCDKSDNIYFAGSFADSVVYGVDTLYAPYGGYCGILLKCNPSGQILWHKVFKSEEALSYSVVTDAESNVYVSGGFFDTLSIDSVILIPPAGSIQDASYIAKFDSSGHLLCYSAINSGGDDMNALAIDPTEPSVYFSGDAAYHDTVVFGRDTIINNNEGTLNEYPTIAKWTCDDILAINEVKTKKEEVVVAPDPSNGKFSIERGAEKESAIIEIYNMLGEKVASELHSQGGTNTQIDLSGQPAGIYLYRVLTETGNLLGEGKFIIQK